MSGKQAIPDVRTGTPIDPFVESVKNTLDRMTGQTKNSSALPVLSASTATLADVIAAYELLRKRLEGA